MKREKVLYMASDGIRKSEYKWIDSKNMHAHLIEITDQRVQI